MSGALCNEERDIAWGSSIGAHSYSFNHPIGSNEGNLNFPGSFADTSGGELLLVHNPPSGQQCDMSSSFQDLQQQVRSLEMKDGQQNNTLIDPNGGAYFSFNDTRGGHQQPLASGFIGHQRHQQHTAHLTMNDNYRLPYDGGQMGHHQQYFPEANGHQQSPYFGEAARQHVDFGNLYPEEQTTTHGTCQDFNSLQYSDESLGGEQQNFHGVEDASPYGMGLQPWQVKDPAGAEVSVDMMSAQGATIPQGQRAVLAPQVQGTASPQYPQQTRFRPYIPPVSDVPGDLQSFQPQHPRQQSAPSINTALYANGGGPYSQLLPGHTPTRTQSHQPIQPAAQRDDRLDSIGSRKSSSPSAQPVIKRSSTEEPSSAYDDKVPIPPMQAPAPAPPAHTGPMRGIVKIPARPRPGRKPIAHDDAVDRRRTQNRMAQRNFRDKRHQKLLDTQAELRAQAELHKQQTLDNERQHQVALNQVRMQFEQRLAMEKQALMQQQLAEGQRRNSDMDQGIVDIAPRGMPHKHHHRLSMPETHSYSRDGHSPAGQSKWLTPTSTLPPISSLAIPQNLIYPQKSASGNNTNINNNHTMANLPGRSTPPEENEIDFTHTWRRVKQQPQSPSSRFTSSRHSTASSSRESTAATTVRERSTSILSSGRNITPTTSYGGPSPPHGGGGGPTPMGVNSSSSPHHVDVDHCGFCTMPDNCLCHPLSIEGSSGQAMVAPGPVGSEDQASHEAAEALQTLSRVTT